MRLASVAAAGQSGRSGESDLSAGGRLPPSLLRTSSFTVLPSTFWPDSFDIDRFHHAADVFRR